MLKDKRNVSYDNFVSSLKDYIKPNNILLLEVQKTLSDAISIVKNFSLSSEIYNIHDINNTLIAYAWYEGRKVVVQPLYQSHVLRKRVN